MLTSISFQHGPGSAYSIGSSALAVVGESTVTYGAFTKGHDGAQEDGTPLEAVAANDHGMIEAKAIHERLRTLQTLGNEMRLEFLDALRVLHDDRLCFELGYSSFHQYCDRELGLAKSTSYEYLKVGKAFGGLPGLRAMFAQGELSWDQARHAARVANPDTEVSWIELAWQVPVAEFLAEARDAARNGRSAPREKRNGLPNLMTKLSIDMTLEDKERTRVAFGLVAGALGEPDEDSADGARPTLLRWVDAVIAGKVPIAARTTGEESGTRSRPAQTIVYHSCRDCRSASVQTEDGRVNVDPARIEAVSADADTVDITADEELVAEPLPAGDRDVPNSAALARKVLLRDGHRCKNPGCGARRDLHGHHIVFRSRGGRTVLANEVAVCDWCHAMVHAGRLEVSGTIESGLEWTPQPWISKARISSTGISMTGTPTARLRDAKALRERLQSLVSETRESTLPPAADVKSLRGAWPRGRESAGADPVRVEALALGLVRLGLRKPEAVGRVESALAQLGGTNTYTDDGEVLRLAIAGTRTLAPIIHEA